MTNKFSAGVLLSFLFCASIHGGVAVLGTRDLTRPAVASSGPLEAGQFVLYFAHFASGGTAGPGSQSTLVVLSNPSDQATQATIRFVNSFGGPAELLVAGFDEPSDVFEIAIGPLGSAKLQTLGAGALQSGWIEVRSDQELSGSAVFQFHDGLGRTFEASVSDAPPTELAVSYVERLTGGYLPVDWNTALGLANPNGEVLHLTLTLSDPSGEVASADVDLEPKRQVARFVSDLFPNLPFVEDGFDSPLRFQGTLVVRAELPFIATALRTSNGLQMSSLRVGQRR